MRQAVMYNLESCSLALPAAAKEAGFGEVHSAGSQTSCVVFPVSSLTSFVTLCYQSD